MADTQDIRVQLLKLLAQLVRRGSLEVWWKWIAVGHGGGEKGEDGGDVLRRSVQSSQETRKVFEPGHFVRRSCRVMGEVVGGVRD